MYDLIIIGAGPSGLTAALYAGRYRLQTLVLEKMVVGGQILLSSTIENFPGFPGGITTQELIERFKGQVDELGVPFETAQVIQISEDIDSETSLYSVKTEEKTLQTKTIIIATGAHWKHLGVPGEHKLVGRGTSYCATCDAPFFKNKKVVVVGGGDKAIEEAIYLTSYASKVTIVHRREGFRAADILLEKAKANQKIEFALDCKVVEILGENKVEAVKVRNLKTDKTGELACDGVFIFIGINPNTEFIKNELETNDAGFIITDNHMRTSKLGIYACGDCREKSLYQVINGCAEGAVAAHSVHTFLMNSK